MKRYSKGYQIKKSISNHYFFIFYFLLLVLKSRMFNYRCALKSVASFFTKTHFWYSNRTNNFQTNSRNVKHGKLSTMKIYSRQSWLVTVWKGAKNNIGALGMATVDASGREKEKRGRIDGRQRFVALARPQIAIKKSSQLWNELFPWRSLRQAGIPVRSLFAARVTEIIRFLQSIFNYRREKSNAEVYWICLYPWIAIINRNGMLYGVHKRNSILWR